MKKYLADLIIPWTIIVGCIVLLACGFDGEVKAVLAMAAGWAFRSSKTIIKEVKNGN
ncbi:MAG: hypothetical protein KKD44_26170 [Proteobacteria bacterium]|nr:hypothetical protein [Patescibacteria group bacterium]MBU1173064.1 hypothetical protein [Pseudomonadota bacterium]